MSFRTLLRITVHCCLAFFVVYAGIGVDVDELTARDEVRCFVRYAPDRVRDFSDLWEVRHREDSKRVNYLMDDGNVVPYDYESPQDAIAWINRVFRQLRECSD